MSAPQTLVQAAINRLSARLGSGLADAAAGLAVLAQDAPERLRREWDLFREEVELEVKRLEHPDDGPAAGGAWPSPDRGTDRANATPSAANLDPQDQIDALRATVARLARRIEDQA